MKTAPATSPEQLYILLESVQEKQDFYHLLQRALNCLDPQKTPSWALQLSDELEKQI